SEEPSGSNPGGGGESSITSITVAASTTNLELGGSVTFTVTGNDGTNLTSSASILVNNSTIQGTEFTPTATGSYQITAKYQSLTSSAINLEVTAPVIVSMRVESNAANVKIGDTATFTVIGSDSSGNDYTITDTASISVNGSAIAGDSFMVIAMGDLQVTATKDDLTADPIDITVTDETAPGTFKRKAIVEDYTGTWCGWCCRVSYAIEQLESQTNDAFVIAAHIGDGMQNTYSQALDNVYVTSGYPTAVINRDQDWTFPEPNNIDQVINLTTGTTTSGLSLNSMVVGDNLQVYVSAAFAQSTPGAKLVVFVLEDGIVASQANYTSYYNGVDPVTDFVHNHVLRHSITNVFGDAIPNTGAGQKHTQVFDIPMPASVSDSSRVSVVAMIVGSDNKLINAARSKTGTVDAADSDFQAN
ncbi:MAG: Omp28-related outer membrane protein, partial [Bacteroidota bacterium]